MYCMIIFIGSTVLTELDIILTEMLENIGRIPDPDLMQARRTAAEPCMKSAS